MSMLSDDKRQDIIKLLRDGKELPLITGICFSHAEERV
jgi:hypothetical protein